MGPEFSSIHQIVAAAQERVPEGVRDHIAGAAGTETTSQRNRLGLDSIAFRPRVLRDVSVIETGTTVLGHQLRIPVVIAPIGSLHTIAPQAALDVVRAAGAFGVVSFTSSVAEPGLEEIAAAGPHLKFFQIYIRGDAVDVGALIDRVKAAGYAGIAVTVDSAYYGIRDRQLLAKWQPPAAHRPGREYQAKVTWNTVAEIKARAAPLPVMLKGIQTAEDAQLAIELGADVVYVSNHGGRQLDHCQATIDILPEVVSAVAGKAEVLVDGGFMRGTDILKAVALGARAVGIGRLYAWALAAGGEAALIRALEILEGEIKNAMGLLGVSRLGELNASYVTAAPPVYTYRAS